MWATVTVSLMHTFETKSLETPSKWSRIAEAEAMANDELHVPCWKAYVRNCCLASCCWTWCTQHCAHWRRSLLGSRPPTFCGQWASIVACHFSASKLIFLPFHIEMIRIIMHASKNRFKNSTFSQSIAIFWGLGFQTSQGDLPWTPLTARPQTPILALSL